MIRIITAHNILKGFWVFSCADMVILKKLVSQRLSLSSLDMGLHAGVCQPQKAQTSPVWSAPLLFTFWKESHLNLLRAKFQFFSWSLKLCRLVWVSLSQKLRRQVFLVSRPILYFPDNEWQRLWSDCTDVHAGMCLFCSHTRKSDFLILRIIYKDSALTGIYISW